MKKLIQGGLVVDGTGKAGFKADAQQDRNVTGRTLPDGKGKELLRSCRLGKGR